MKRATITIIVVISTVLSLHSQVSTYYLDPQKKLSQYIFENWSTEDGLPTNSLLHLCQTHDGYLWISSYNGLIRFDGINFKVFNKNNTEVFESDAVRKLAEDQTGTLWMTTQTSGLVSYKNGQFTAYGKDLGILHLYRALYIDSNNRIWSASPDKGWFYFDKGKFTFLNDSLTLKDIEVRNISEDQEGNLWFCTLGHGLYQYKNGSFRVFTTTDGLTSNWVYSLLVEKEGMWIGTNAGLCYFDGTNFVNLNQQVPQSITDIQKDEYGNLWIGTINGLFRKKENSREFEYLSSASGLIYDFINDLLIDIEGNLWMTNYKGGLSKLKDGKFIIYTESGGLPGKVVNAICEYAPNSFIVAFDNGCVSKIIDGAIVGCSMSSLSGKRIRHIFKDSHENLWFSTYSGLLKLSPDKRETWFSEKNGFPATQMRLAFQDSKGNLWFGSRNNGLIKLSVDNRITVINTSNGLSSNLIMSIDEDKKGNLWVGTSEGEIGLNIIKDDKVIKRITDQDGFFSDIVFNTYIDNDGNVWIAASGSLSCYYKEKFYSITTKQGLVSDSPFDIVEDDIGFFWMPYSKGIMRVKKQNLLDYFDKKTQTITCQSFDKHDGMKESECNSSSQSVKSSNGNILFPTIDGIAQINPNKIPVNTFIPPVIIEGLTIDNTPVNIHDKIIIDPGKKRLTFKYTAINLYEPSKVKFQYKLVGFEDEWIEAGASRTISFTNLSHGNYTLKVIASNNDGVWNNTGASVSFHIKPKFIETIWFYLTIIIAVTILAYLTYQARIRTLKYRQLLLESTIKARTSELVEANKALEHQKIEIQQKNITLTTQKEEIQEQKQKLEKQTFELNNSNLLKDKMFSVIAHDLRNSLGNFSNTLEIINSPGEIEPSERDELLKMLDELSKSTYHLLENLLNWSLSHRGIIDFNPIPLSVKPIIDDIITQAKPSSDKKMITIHQRVGDDIRVLADVNMVKTIFRNLIGNAIKFTPKNGKIFISAKSLNNYVQFGIQDTGIGMKEELLKKIFTQLEFKTTFGTENEQGSGLGLMLCKDFVEKNGGTIHAESNEGQGSTFYFTLKAT